MAPVPVLFARRDSIYKTLDCDVYDRERDARTWPGGAPAIFHPPCAHWGQLYRFATQDTRDLAPWAVERVRQFGGVLEHPAHSRLWAACQLPAPGERDHFGGFTLELPQLWFGPSCDEEHLALHRARAGAGNPVGARLSDARRRPHERTDAAPVHHESRTRADAARVGRISDRDCAISRGR